MQDTKDIVGFYKILKQVSQEAHSQYAKDRIFNDKLTPYLEVAQQKQAETIEATTILDAGLTIPFMGLSQIEHLTQVVEKGLILEPAECVEYADFLRSARLIKAFLTKNKFLAPNLAAYSEILGDFTAVEQEIYGLIQNGKLIDEASRELKKIRKQIKQNKEAIDQKLKKFINHSTNRDKIQEPVVVEKQGRLTVPIKSTYKRLVQGTLVVESSKGLTAYIEPDTVKKIVDEQLMLKAEEQSEVFQILAYLTGLIHSNMEAIHTSRECIVELEVIFARAKYSRSINGRQVRLNKSEKIHLNNVYSPLLEKPVPLSLCLDGSQARGLVVTGSNAGGKTVVLKTVALICFMARMGLLIPCDKGTDVAIFEEVFVEIGDNQSIERSLSTFSSHMQVLAQIQPWLKRHTLVLLDEIGSGTEPREGSALAIATIDNFYRRGAMVMVTTHYGEVKSYAKKHPQLLTAAMAFDLDNLAPTYQLLMHETGDSQAFAIASKMKLSESILKCAKDILTTNHFPLEIKLFDPIQLEQNESTYKNESVSLQKGDRIYASEFKKEGLFYELNPQDHHAKVFIEGEWYETPIKRVDLLISSRDLYPENYDIERLFMDYKEYKKYHDLYRGSKKAWK